MEFEMVQLVPNWKGFTLLFVLIAIAFYAANVAMAREPRVFLTTEALSVNPSQRPVVLRSGTQVRVWGRFRRLEVVRPDSGTAGHYDKIGESTIVFFTRVDEARFTVNVYVDDAVETFQLVIR